jgi:predicted RecB family endonuclease
VLGTLHGNAYQEDVSKNEYRDRWVWRAELNDDATGKRMVFRSLSDLYSTLQASLTNDIETIELVKAHDKATKELEDAKAALDTIADKLIQAALSEEYTDRKLQEHRRELEMKERESENSN